MKFKLKKKTRRKIHRLLAIPFWFCLLALLGIIYHFGFEHTPKMLQALNIFYVITLSLSVLSIIGRHLVEWQPSKFKIKATDAILAVLFVILIARHTFLLGLSSDYLPHFAFLDKSVWLHIALFIAFFRELSALNVDAATESLNPAMLFLLSFMLIIFLGSMLLMLPRATYTGIAYTDALFTSTSAVCVTGLIVVDTAKDFTYFGQIVIMLLIQIGGIGIMTFTSYFSYFFKGGSSFETQLALREMTSSNKIAEVFSTLRKIILLTFIVEAIGALLIYSSLDKSVLTVAGDRIFFAIFHAISGFCNAGFSILTDGLYDINFRYNYTLHMSLAMLLITGGLGFPIVFNFINYFKHAIRNKIRKIIGKKSPVYLPWVININSRIVIITTAVLLGGGTMLMYVLEYNNTLAEHDSIGKLVTAFFSAATPRTAGFNTVNFAALNLSSIIIVIFLMWVGASPASTGGGIKTSTLAIGVLNVLSLAREKDRIEVYRREISNNSVRRAFAIAFLSVVVIGTSIVLVTVFDKDKKLVDIAFECVSAFSTTGLSLGITAALSTSSKVVLIITMFIGRVGTLTILVALIRKAKLTSYKYPTENILIN
ncbi:MAG: TrkH family potassium uptake protein [Bacteroidia bacterium]